MKSDEDPMAEIHVLPARGEIPNNRLPLILYRAVLAPKAGELSAGSVKELFKGNGWTGCWENGIYPFQHYHSTAHEVLGCFRGFASVLFGGDQGLTVEFRIGDAVVIPAGVGHRNLGSSKDFRVIGAYPPGQDHDMCYGRPGERPKADENISRVPLPDTDPVHGRGGPLFDHWK